MSPREFVTRHGITAGVKFVRTDTEAPDTMGGKGWEHDVWTIHFRNREGRRMQVTFRTGTGWRTGHGAPTALDVLESLQSDIPDDGADFETWADDLGFDPDSRKAERIYKACVAQTERLARFLGDDAFTELQELEF